MQIFSRTVLLYRKKFSLQQPFFLPLTMGRITRALADLLDD